MEDSPQTQYNKKPRGRPRTREKRGPILQLAIGLSPEAMEWLDNEAKASERPRWSIVQDLILEAKDGQKPMPHEAREIAQAAADFLTSCPDRSKGAEALKRAWSGALAMAKHDIGR